MKISISPACNLSRTGLTLQKELNRARLTHQHGREGMAVIVVLTFITIVMIYLAFNLRTLAYLGRDLRLIERHQIRRLQTAGAAPVPRTATNATPATAGALPP